MTCGFLPPPIFQRVIFLLPFLYICIFLCARPKHTFSFSQNSTWRSPNTAGVVGGEQQQRQGWLRWVTSWWQEIVGAPMDLGLCGVTGGCNISTCGVCGCLHEQSGAWFLAPCRKEAEGPRGILVLRRGWERGGIVVDLENSRM